MRQLRKDTRDVFSDFEKGEYSSLHHQNNRAHKHRDDADHLICQMPRRQLEQNDLHTMTESGEEDEEKGGHFREEETRKLYGEGMEQQEPGKRIPGI